MNRILVLMLLFSSSLFAQQNRIIPEARIMNDLLTKDVDLINFQSPIILSNAILFFYKGKASSVEIAGDFNDWQNNLIMEESRSNFWVYSLRTRVPQGKYRYRLKVDGFWIADPMNPNSENDFGRQRLSILNLTNNFTPNKRFPTWLSNNIYRFQYQSTNAQLITIAGDFNNWNPYSHQLTHKGAGIFQVDIALDPKNIYLYSFVEDGKWVADPENKKQYVNDIGRPVNGFYADETNSLP